MHKLILPAIARRSGSSPFFAATSAIAIAMMFNALAITQAVARNEAKVGQCGLTFIGVGQSCEDVYGGAKGDPVDGDKLNACWQKATDDYNSCMDDALASPASMGTSNPPKRKIVVPGPPSSGLLNDSTGLPTQGPAATGGARGTRGGGSGTLY
jgi:hypothetical protein